MLDLLSATQRRFVYWDLSPQSNNESKPIQIAISMLDSKFALVLTLVFALPLDPPIHSGVWNSIFRNPIRSGSISTGPFSTLIQSRRCRACETLGCFQVSTLLFSPCIYLPYLSVTIVSLHTVTESYSIVVCKNWQFFRFIKLNN